jgi:DNA-binding response OmpR family regulator
MTDKPKFLLVENDTPLAMMVVNVLTLVGCDVEVAHTGKKGMELSRENKFSLIVLSMDLPDIRGFDLASELKQRHLSRRTPIIFVANQLREEDQRRSQKLGAVDYIAKPFGAEEFARRLLSHIKQSEAVA